jgi:hypothetical protein
MEVPETENTKSYGIASVRDISTAYSALPNKDPMGVPVLASAVIDWMFRAKFFLK